MISIKYEAQVHRLRIEGECGAQDRDHVAEAIDTYGAHEESLTIDLTGTTKLHPAVAGTIVADCRRAREEGRRYTVVRRCDSEADIEVRRAEQEARDDAT